MADFDDLLVARAIPVRPVASPMNRDVMIVGDSFFFRHTYNGNNMLVWDTGPNPVGNRYISHGEVNWLRYRMRQGFNFDGSRNFGVFGETNPQISARFGPALAQSDAATVIRIVSINASSDAAWYSETMSAIATDVAAAKAAGRYLILLLPAATGDGRNSTTIGNRMSALKRATRHRLRNDIMQLYGFSREPGIDVIDMDAGYADPSSAIGDALTTSTSEGIHPSTAGARARSSLELPIFARRFHPRRFAIGNNTDIYDATNTPQGAINTNPALTGTGGTAGTGGTGSVADGWQGGNGGDTGHTRTYSKVTGPNTGRPAQRCVLGGTFGGANMDISVLLQAVTMVSGARYKVQAEFDGWSGIAGLGTIALQAQNTTSFALWAADMDYSGDVGVMHPTELDGVMETPEFVADATTGRIRIIARGLAGSAMAGSIDILGVKLIRLS